MRKNYSICTKNALIRKICYTKNGKCATKFVFPNFCGKNLWKQQNEIRTGNFFGCFAQKNANEFYK